MFAAQNVLLFFLKLKDVGGVCFLILVCPISGVLLLVALPKAHTECTNQHLCKNEYTRIKNFARTHWNLTEVPHDIPAEAESVTLSGNVITSIPAGVFSHLSFCILLTLSSNMISSVDKEAFSGTESLKLLWLSHNKISVIEPETFPLSLTYVTLAYNLLSIVPSGIFTGLHHLKSFSIAVNPISHIETGAFDDLHSLIAFSMTNWTLTTLNPDLFLNLPRPLSLSLSDHKYGDRINKWRCSSLCWLKQEEQKGTVTFDDTRFPFCMGDRNWSVLECPDPGKWMATCPPSHKGQYIFQHIVEIQQQARSLETIEKVTQVLHNFGAQVCCWSLLNWSLVDAGKETEVHILFWHAHKISFIRVDRTMNVNSSLTCQTMIRSCLLFP